MADGLTTLHLIATNEYGGVREITPSELPRAMKFSSPFYLAIPKGQQTFVAGIVGAQLDELYA